MVQSKIAKILTRPIKVKILKLAAKNTPPNTNTIGKIQTSESDQSIDSDDHENDPMGWKISPIW